MAMNTWVNARNGTRVVKTVYFTSIAGHLTDKEYKKFWKCINRMN